MPVLAVQRGLDLILNPVIAGEIGFDPADRHRFGKLKREPITHPRARVLAESSVNRTLGIIKRIVSGNRDWQRRAEVFTGSRNSLPLSY